MEVATPPGGRKVCLTVTGVPEGLSPAAVARLTGTNWTGGMAPPVVVSLIEAVPEGGAPEG